MELNLKGLENRKEWQTQGYNLPHFDERRVKQDTLENPEWIHFGAGNIFRAYQAHIVQKLLDQGKLNKGLIVVEGYDYEIIEKAFIPYDNYSILVTLKANGEIEKSVIGSIMEALKLDRQNLKDFERLKEIFRNPSLKWASFTITEKGYSLVDNKGCFLAQVGADIRKGPEYTESYMGKIVSLVYERFISGELPIALVSMDNCSHNGEKLHQAVAQIAEGWVKQGHVDKSFVAYIHNPQKVSFPWSMIDKITPRPDPFVGKMLQGDGIKDIAPIITQEHTYIAPFVNTEEVEYLVIEDAFPNGKVNLEAGGIIYTSRATVEQVEKMKVCTCLNPLHTTLAIFGCLLGYKLISEEMKEDCLKYLVEFVGYQEGLPVVTDPKIIEPEQFIKEVLEVRMPNPFMPDSPQRIATDTSQKLSVRFGETLKAYIQDPQMDIKSLRGIPLVFAGWLRYLMAVDDQGNKMHLSSDPMLEVVCPLLKNIHLGECENPHLAIAPILEMENIFGVNLYKVGIGEQVEYYFREMIKGIGAVRRTLQTFMEEEGA